MLTQHGRGYSKKIVKTGESKKQLLLQRLGEKHKTMLVEHGLFTLEVEGLYQAFEYLARVTNVDNLGLWALL